jgi:TolB-like protein
VEVTPSRKLAVILHADIVGSTALVQMNETLAHQRIRDAFNRLAKTIDRYNGIAHEIRGDALVAEFSRASDAVSAAATFQAANSVHASMFGDNILPLIRVGIAIGEVVIADNTVTGEGVVLAQRIEQLAEQEGICIQGAARETIPRRLPFDYESLGECELKGFEEPVRVYKLQIKPGSVIPEPENQIKKSDSAAELLDKPSIAVLPFTNMSGDKEQEYFSDGITEDIITALSRMPWFFVIARNSTFVYKDHAVDIKQVATELAVQYVLEGSVRKAGNRVRITAQLIDALTNKHVWAGRYDRELADVFAVQDEVVESIVGEVAPEFLSAEAKRARHVDPAALNAWDLVMRGRWHMWKLGRQDLARARDFFEQAIGIVASGEFGASDLALTHLLEGYYNWTQSRPESMQAMLKFAEQAVMADDHDAWAHTILGLAKLFAHQWDEIMPPLDHAIALYPNFAPALGVKGMALACLDEADAAIECYETAARLSPHDSLIPLWLIGVFWASWSEARYQDALVTAQKTVRLAPDNPTGRRQLVASYVATEQMDKAKLALADYLEIEPDHTVADIRVPSRNPEPLQRFVDALRSAGLPE